MKGYIVYKAKASSDKGVKIYEDETPSSSYKLSDAHIFLPAAGARNFGCPHYAGSYGYYWSSSLRTGHPYFAWGVYFYSNFVDKFDCVYRYFGQSVRAVCPAE